ncbi:hypothetical protein AMAG_11261 [Allomyces macrogynus ATCC 38327]|uniref:Synaptobrevin n=1 Tax=Allomyces macrogynus (strain ATCC 38327) TaxID=578462 RepID=A0A0L0SW77_ALLM3|nr:hypothetical protein AMAG_11261 [Allomyces macrogynus ATCC 38327]|eukprot:KNE66767.1 hypothetical protein AMAG_11261 [Allomyces macrogynus ATCC 38327]
MKIFSIIVLTGGKPSEIRASESDLSQFGFFQRGSVQEFMNFTAKTLVERTGSGQRQSVEQDEFMVHCYLRPDNLAGVIITDREYPLRVAFTLISKILDDFTATFTPATTWATLTPNAANPAFPQLKEQFVKYQDPHSADSLMKVQKELDETKVILHKTIESVLEREEKLDALVERSNALSMQTKAFFKTAKKTNSCCSLM